ncbi:hypothetical protein J6590_037754, partial [Homalodisca vitripennis]
MPGLFYLIVSRILTAVGVNPWTGDSGGEHRVHNLRSWASESRQGERKLPIESHQCMYPGSYSGVGDHGAQPPSPIV